MNCSEILLGEKQTNNRAEMSAAIIALSQAIAEGLTNITIISDSRYMKEGISKLDKKWKINGWKSQTKTDILNKDLRVLLDSLRNKVIVTWKWVEGHGTTQGNIEADTLASIGVSDSSSFWQKCAICPGLEESIILPTKSNVHSAKTAEMEVSSTPKRKKERCAASVTKIHRVKRSSVANVRARATICAQDYRDINYTHYTILIASIHMKSV